MSKRIPHDLIIDILSRQPVKSLLRFRCLSKTCCSLIDSEYFIKLHLNHSITTKFNLSLIYRGLDDLYALEFDKLVPRFQIDHPLNIGSDTEVLGSCNGLIAFSNSVHDLALYNPSTRKLKALPPCAFELPADWFVTCFLFAGFGHDKINDDYKLVGIMHFIGIDGDDGERPFGYEVEVYSLKTNSWRRISNLPIFLGDLYDFLYHSMLQKGYGVFAGGALHWVSPKRNAHLMYEVVAFDLAAEEFHQLPLPEPTNPVDKNEVSNEIIHVDLGSLEGCLCIFHCYDRVYVDMWMMKEYGVKESWTKMFSVQRPRIARSLSLVKPLGFSRTGDKILLELKREKLVWFDLKKQIYRRVKIDGHSWGDSLDSQICVGSLVPLSSGCGDVGIHGMKRRNLEEKEKKTKKRRDDFLSTGFKLVL